METEDFKIPHNRVAEEAVLGGIFIDETQLIDVFDILQEHDFYIVRHQWIYSAMIELFSQGCPIDLLTVTNVLETRGQLEEVGGPAYLTSLINQCPMSGNTVHYARIVEQFAVRRRMIEQANAIASLAYDEKKSMDDVSKEYETLVTQVPTSSKSTLITASQAVESFDERIDLGIPLGVSTGLSVPDREFGGFARQGLALFIADASSGKTALMLQVCEQLDFAGGRPLYVTLEEPAWKMVGRRVFPNTGIDRVKLRNNTLTPGERALLKQESAAYRARHPRLAFDQEARSVWQIRRSAQQHRADLVIVDDLLHVHNETKGRNDNGNEAFGIIKTVTMLKDVAIDLNCAVVLIHHLSTEEANKNWVGGPQKQKPTKNTPPSLDSIPWSKGLRFTIDQWVALVPDFKADITADTVEMIMWLMKDKEAARLSTEIHLWYNKLQQWWYDKDSYHLMPQPKKNLVAAQVPTGTMQQAAIPVNIP